MTFRILKALGSSFLLVASLAASLAVEGATGTSGSAAPANTASAQIPTTTAAIWQAIDQKTAELKQTVQSGSLENAHHQGFAIRDLVAALGQRSTSLSTDQQAKVNSNVKFVATLADRLDVSGDATDRPASQANYDKLVKVLADLRTSYEPQSSK